MEVKNERKIVEQSSMAFLFLFFLFFILLPLMYVSDPDKKEQTFYRFHVPNDPSNNQNKEIEEVHKKIEVENGFAINLTVHSREIKEMENYKHENLTFGEQRHEDREQFNE